MKFNVPVKHFLWILVVLCALADAQTAKKAEAADETAALPAVSDDQTLNQIEEKVQQATQTIIKEGQAAAQNASSETSEASAILNEAAAEDPAVEAVLNEIPQAETPAAPAETPGTAAVETPAATPATEPEPAIKPTVTIQQRGAELQLDVLYDHPMDFAGKNYIESIKMESPAGDFLGMKNFNENETKALAIFMVNPTLYTHKEVVFTAVSTQLGPQKYTSKLEVTPIEAPAVEAPKAIDAAASEAAKTVEETVAQAPAAEEKSEVKAAQKESKPKKKFGLW